MIKAFGCTKFNTISALREQRRVLRKRHDFNWMGTQTCHVRPGGQGREKKRRTDEQEEVLPLPRALLRRQRAT